jgi:2-polyprenyl-3-methyl-5-hydroxy-6-metoxy-1,4-benzoquinol methylase
MMNDNFKTVFHKLKKINNPLLHNYDKNSKTSFTGINLIDNELSIDDIFYIDLLCKNKQSIVFYLEILPDLYGHMLDLKLPLYQAYSLLDVGTQSGAGANFLGELFSTAHWSYSLKLEVDTLDIDPQWNKYNKLNPFVRRHINEDIFNIDEDSYDICFCSHVIEHLDDPVSFVRQLKKISKLFAVITCPFNETDPIPSHHTIDKNIVDQCNPIKFRTFKSVNRWHDYLENVVFIV